MKLKKIELLTWILQLHCLTNRQVITAFLDCLQQPVLRLYSYVELMELLFQEGRLKFDGDIDGDLNRTNLPQFCYYLSERRRIDLLYWLHSTFGLTIPEVAAINDSRCSCMIISDWLEWSKILHLSQIPPNHSLVFAFPSVNQVFSSVRLNEGYILYESKRPHIPVQQKFPGYTLSENIVTLFVRRSEMEHNPTNFTMKTRKRIRC